MSLPTALQPLIWDTEFLGFPVARLDTTNLDSTTVVEAVAAARQAGLCLLYAVAHPAAAEIAAALRQQGGWLADRKVTYAQPLLGPTILANAAITEATGYTPQLESLAWQSGEYSRFRLDPHFAPAVFRELYSRWLHNSLDGLIARRVLVWRTLAGHEAGLLTLGEKNGRADIGLLAVDAAMRGQYVGQQLVAAAQAQAAAWGYQQLQVVTQGENVAACHFYEKCGFALDGEEHIYHLWLT